MQKSRFSHQYWRVSTDNKSAYLEQNVKESQNLLFFKGAIYENTFNVEVKFRNTQLGILFDLPSEDYLSYWRKLRVLKAAVGKKYVDYEPNMSKEAFIHHVFDRVEIGIALERTQYIPNNVQAK